MVAGWQAINRALYGARYRWQARATLRADPLADAATAMRSSGQPSREPGSRDALLHIAWGRIGDAVLGTATLQHFRRAFPGLEIVHLGRAETRPIIEPLVDRFVALDDADTLVGSEWHAVLSDVHLFYGGTFALDHVLASLRSEHRLLYEGYHLGPGLAPYRHVPQGFDVLPALAKNESRVAERHVLHDQAHLLASATTRIRGLPYEVDPAQPVLALDLTADPDLGDAIAIQPLSNNPKKDYPIARWRQVIAAFPDLRFVALGGAESRDRVAAELVADNLDNRCGDTDLLGAASVIASTRVFLGPDSGLTHIAATLRRPTVCVAQSANLGYFFPYPRALGFDWLTVIDHEKYFDCSGCFMTCEHESIATTARRGAKCLRELPAGLITRALENALSEVAPPAQPAYG